MAQTRKFIDSEGVHWQVYELSDDAPTADPGARSWLYFFSRGATRSLANYPDDWSVMDWPGLDRLCQHARPPARLETSRRLAAVHGAEILTPRTAETAPFANANR